VKALRNKKAIQIGIVLCDDIAEQAVPALKFLLLQLNTLQSTFEYQFLPVPDDQFLDRLASGKVLERIGVERELPGFANAYLDFLHQRATAYELPDVLPDQILVVSRATFGDRYYVTGSEEVTILALGNWERIMAPPSLVEFIVTLTLSASVDTLPLADDPTHLGTKGCLFDFNENLSNARFMSLQGFICQSCRCELDKAGYPRLADELAKILDKRWMGTSTDSSSPAGITAKLGYDLFLTKGLVPRFRERFLSNIEQEGIKALIKFIGEIILAGALVYLGLKATWK
jgi:hypothetical protein